MSVLPDLRDALAQRDRPRFLGLLNSHFAGDHNYRYAVGISEWILGAAPPILRFRDDPSLSGDAQMRERLCNTHLLTSLYQTARPAPSGQRSIRRRLGPEYDSFGDRFELTGWGVMMTLNFIMMQQIRATRRVAAVVTMRDDGLTLLEWIAHYRILGFQHIFVFSNDNADGSDALLDALARHDVITFLEQDTELVVSPQMRAFDYSIHLMNELRDFEWVIYLDSDEFLILDEQDGRSIHNFLDRVDRVEPTASAVLFPWRWYVSANRFAWAPDLLLRRFQHARTAEYKKTMVRLAEITSMRQVHFPETAAPAVIVEADLARAGGDAPSPTDLHPRHAVLNHYWCKSFEEFMIKQRRGMTITGETRRAFNRDETKFFTWNGPETAQTHVEPPATLLCAVEAELKWLRALDEVEGLETRCRHWFLNTRPDQDHYERVKAQAIGS